MCETSHYLRRSKTVPFRLPLGEVVFMERAVEALAKAGDPASRFLERHARGDWGEVCEEDRRRNDDAAVCGRGVASAYTTSAGDKLGVFTAANRSGTLVLVLPEKY